MRIYLDFDGCIHRAGRDKIMFEHIESLEAILREYPTTHVVISSSWREEHSFDEMRSYFAVDVQRQITGVTPVLPGVARHDEIIKHLRDTQFAGDFIVIDDDSSEFPTCWPPLFLCDPNRGLDVERQGDLRRLLNEMQKNVLFELSTGAISLIDATAKLGLQDAGYTLQKLREAGLAMPQLPAHVVKAQSDASLEAMRSMNETHAGKYRHE